MTVENKIIVKACPDDKLDDCLISCHLLAISYKAEVQLTFNEVTHTINSSTDFYKLYYNWYK